MLKHVVFMKFKPGVTEEEIGDLAGSLGKLPGVVPEIQGFEFGRDLVRSERSYDFALVSTFADLDAMNRYQVHPEHQRVVAKVRQLSQSVLAVDFETR
ncbi:MAG TPA: Dabb family protein [Syntrophobacteraceae bacterium]|nr:Dabb family protein [Syntrophobacteraceae bacterium]